jgi:hypothetical protein
MLSLTEPYFNGEFRQNNACFKCCDRVDNVLDDHKWTRASNSYRTDVSPRGSNFSDKHKLVSFGGNYVKKKNSL